MKLPASLESLRSRKNVTDDVMITLTFSVWCTPEQLGQIQALYKKPIDLEITESR